ncbi:hypothetical protein [Ferrimonas sp. YFM]|uniref:hypothetical protein n=1 Tax=Ferrimonas sp. YFM TaxID=3028878 RepID=UPI002573A15B|nr:hypothetical protein [Ferrimonas sp. YFM]BDY04899.1 membrane protein [Ferrimonas sp. YFM]
MATTEPTRPGAQHQPWRLGVLAAVMLVPLVLLVALAPIQQDRAYHNFADTRVMLGVPHGLDVLSSLAFSLVGVLGLAHCIRARLGASHAAWSIMFAALVLVGLGSGYYHWQPTNDSLVWDRLPMAVGFMGLFTTLMTEHLHGRLSALLVPAILLGVVSVGYWHWWGDLWLYIWIQLLPLLIIPVLVALFPSGHSHQWLLLAALGCYLAAKVTELYDLEIFRVTAGGISGHTLKHLLAALGGYFILLMLRLRRSRQA